MFAWLAHRSLRMIEPQPIFTYTETLAERDGQRFEGKESEEQRTDNFLMFVLQFKQSKKWRGNTDTSRVTCGCSKLIPRNEKLYQRVNFCAPLLCLNHLRFLSVSFLFFCDFPPGK